MFYEIATLTLPFGTAAPANAGVEAFSTSPEAAGNSWACGSPTSGC